MEFSVFILFQVKFKIVSDQISRWISHIIYYCRCRTFEFESELEAYIVQCKNINNYNHVYIILPLLL